MTCKACGFSHPPMQDCKVAARIRANTVTRTVTKIDVVTPAVTRNRESVTPAVTHNPYDNTPDLPMFDKRRQSKRSNADRQREYRARKAA